MKKSHSHVTAGNLFSMLVNITTKILPKRFEKSKMVMGVYKKCTQVDTIKLVFVCRINQATLLLRAATQCMSVQVSICTIETTAD